MKDWEYRELIEAIQATYQEFVDEGLKPLEATSRCMGEFETVADSGYCERVIVYASGTLLFSKITKIMPIGLYTAYKDVLSSYDIGKGEECLGSNDSADLQLRVMEAKEALSLIRPYDLGL